VNADATSRPGVATRAATAGAELALESFRTDIATETKSSDIDVVTQADRDAQARVIEVIESEYPNEPIVGEEDDALKTVPDSGPAWIVDPIDGTTNFVNDSRVWGTAVAAVEDGKPVGAAVVLPALGDSYTADRGRQLHRRPRGGVSERGPDQRQRNERAGAGNCLAADVVGR